MITWKTKMLELPIMLLCLLKVFGSFKKDLINQLQAERKMITKVENIFLRTFIVIPYTCLKRIWGTCLRESYFFNFRHLLIKMLQELYGNVTFFQYSENLSVLTLGGKAHAHPDSPRPPTPPQTMHWDLLREIQLSLPLGQPATCKFDRSIKSHVLTFLKKK